MTDKRARNPTLKLIKIGCIKSKKFLLKRYYCDRFIKSSITNKQNQRPDIRYIDFMEYRRAKTPGATYFFTVVTYNRRKILYDRENVDLLRNAFRYVIKQHPFKIDAIVILPEHIHCIWTLPKEDADFSMRWRLIKSWFSRQCHSQYQGNLSASRHSKGEKAVWQRRFWEHQIQDERDFLRHVEYIHYNPVHHGLVDAPKDWEFSSFHRYVRDGIYELMWGSSSKIVFDVAIGME